MKFVVLWILRVTIPDPAEGTSGRILVELAVLSVNEVSYVHIPDKVNCDSMVGDSVFEVNETGK